MGTGMVPKTGSKPDGSVVQGNGTAIMDCEINELFYGTFKAVRDVAVPIDKNAITSFIGPSGRGKSTVLRCLNRMNDLVRGSDTSNYPPQ